MAIQIAIGGALEIYSSGADWAKVRCTNGAAPEWQDEIGTDGDGFATLSGVVTSPHEQGFILRWNATPADYTLLVITHGGGSGQVYGPNRLVDNGAVDWEDLESRGCRIVDVKWHASSDGRWSRPSAAPVTLNYLGDRLLEVYEWIHANLNQRNVPIATIGSSGGADAAITPFTHDSPMASRIFCVIPCSYPIPFWNSHAMCHETTPAGTFVDPDTGALGGTGVGVQLSGVDLIDDCLTTGKCALGTVTEGELADFDDEDNLDAITPWYQGTLLVTTGQAEDITNGVVWGAGQIYNHAFWGPSRKRWVTSETDGHGDALSDVTSEGFAEVHAELAALADGGGLAMAAYNKFQDFVEQLLLAKHDFGASGHVFKVYLSNAAPSASADAVKADLAEISAGNGYTAGGTDVQNTVSETTGTATVGATDVVWTASGGTIGPFQYVALYNDTQTTPADPLVAWWDYGSALTLNDGETFTVDFGSNSLFTLV